MDIVLFFFSLHWILVKIRHVRFYALVNLKYNIEKWHIQRDQNVNKVRNSSTQKWMYFFKKVIFFLFHKFEEKKSFIVISWSIKILSRIKKKFIKKKKEKLKHRMEIRAHHISSFVYNSRTSFYFFTLIFHYFNFFIFWTNKTSTMTKKTNKKQK